MARRVVLMSLVLTVCLALSSVEAKVCETRKYGLARDGWVSRFVADTSSGRMVVDLTMKWKRSSGTFYVYVAVNDEFQGRYRMPVELFGGKLQAYHETDYTYEPGSDGRLQSVLKSLPKVEACRSWRKIEHVRLAQSVLRDHVD